MAGYSTRTEGAREELSKRQERAQRILDAAAELIQRWGYKKTAVDDIARLAGVAKGTIYLHWKTREDLFTTLLLRESVEATKVISARIVSDPEGFRLSNVVKHSFYVIMTRPLSRALFIQDANVLGELLQQGHESLDTLTQQKLIVGRQLLELFRAKGLLRTDQSMDKQLKMYSTMVVGAMTVNQYLPADLQSPPEEGAQLLATMIQETLELAEPLTPTIQQELKMGWEHSIQQILDILEERLQAELA
ncbi:MAG TPA: helix-turn-helix domain-containing protein [Ktedonobacteraceae bacterium]